MTLPEEQYEHEPANRPITGKRAPTRTSWKKGESGNPAGRKSNGQSWAEILREATDKTPDELAAEVGGEATWLGRALLQDYPPGVPMRLIVAINVLLEIAHKPSAGLLNSLMASDALATLGDRVSALERDAAERRDSDKP